MKFYSLLKLQKSIKSRRLKLLGLWLASVLGFRHLSVRLDTSLRCNLACRMCYFSSEDYRKKAGGILKKEELEGIAKSLFPRAFQLVIGCGAEPTLVRHYHELFALAKKYGVSDKSLVTNGQLLSKNDLEQLADSGLNELIVSVHGVYRESYEYLMPGARYVRLLELLENYRQLKELRGTDCPELRINYTVNPDNLYELNDFFSVFGEFGISTIQLRPVMDIGGEYKGSIDEGLKSKYREIVEQIRVESRKRGVRLLANTSDTDYKEKNKDASLAALVYTYVSPRTASQLGIDWRSTDLKKFKKADRWYSRLAEVFFRPKSDEGWLDRSLKYDEIG